MSSCLADTNRATEVNEDGADATVKKKKRRSPSYRRRSERRRVKLMEDKGFEDSGKQDKKEAAATPVAVPDAVAAVETEPTACTEQRQAAGENGSRRRVTWAPAAALSNIRQYQVDSDPMHSEPEQQPEPKRPGLFQLMAQHAMQQRAAEAAQQPAEAEAAAMAEDGPERCEVEADEAAAGPRRRGLASPSGKRQVVEVVDDEADGEAPAAAAEFSATGGSAAGGSAAGLASKSAGKLRGRRA